MNRIDPYRGRVQREAGARVAKCGCCGVSTDYHCYIIEELVEMKKHRMRCLRCAAVLAMYGVEVELPDQRRITPELGGAILSKLNAGP